MDRRAPADTAEVADVVTSLGAGTDARPAAAARRAATRALRRTRTVASRRSRVAAVVAKKGRPRERLGDVALPGLRVVGETDCAALVIALEQSEPPR